MQQADRKQNQQRGVEHGKQSDILSDRYTQDVFQDPREDNGGDKSDRKEDGYQGEGFQLAADAVNPTSGVDTANGFEKKPVCQDDSDTELVSGEDDHQFAQQEYLGNQSAEAHHKDCNSNTLFQGK